MGIRESTETLALRMLSRPGRTSQFRDQLVTEAGIGPDTNVIDIATAVGGMAFAAHEKTEHVTAIDESQKRIKIARSDPRSRGIDFMVMDATKTSFADKQFDVAFIVLGLHEMTVEGAKEALKEARRISKRLVVMEFGFERWPAFWKNFKYFLITEPKGFFEFTKQNVGKMIQEAGWHIQKENESFPFVTYSCE
ncbi:MAG: class I SAM-dependent methyltransferase [Candidatus Aquicultor sp.]